MEIWGGGLAFCQVFGIFLFNVCVLWEGGLGYVVLTFRRGLGKLWRNVCM